MPEPSLAFLSKQKLHLRRDGVTQVVESDFERTVRERSTSIERRHAWKTQGRGAMFMRGAWGAEPNGRDDAPVLRTGLTAGPDGALLYSMETDAVSGIFLLDAAGVETRLFHTADFRIRHAAIHPDGATLAATVFHADSMRSNIAVLPVHGSDFSEVTEGDSFDQAPRWVPGAKRRIVFQSAGVGRDAAGRFAGLGPCTIQSLDLDSGDLEEAAEEESHDLLQPRQTAAGTLYYIRKPYESGAPGASLLGALKDAALFPFRMARAVFQYCNIFSMMYTGKPLVSGKGAMHRRMDPRQMFIYGNLARAQMPQAAGDDAHGLVPGSWELVRRAPGGQTETVAKKVLAFDLAADGSVLCSDGAAITRISPHGRTERIVQAELIEHVLAL
ncbi:MAG: hypothetical protein IT167_09760 [Bryobacterales bacterium]|nr:hypothetical protein [Bryobacterales bacterium]